jgi:hypothetical protein
VNDKYDKYDNNNDNNNNEDDGDDDIRYKPKDSSIPHKNKPNNIVKAETLEDIKSKIDKNEFKSKREEQIERLKQIKKVITLEAEENVKLYEVEVMDKNLKAIEKTRKGAQKEQGTQNPDKANIMTQTTKL